MVAAQCTKPCEVPMGILRTQLESTQQEGMTFPGAPTTSALGVASVARWVGGGKQGEGKRKERAEAGVGQRHGGTRELLDPGLKH